jgi:hypothetical protein
MQWQWKSFMLWTGAIVVIVLATILYQPAAAKTGSLLVWTQNRIYIVDIDTLNLKRVGRADPDEPITPSPGCFRQMGTDCWLLVNDRLYKVDFSSNSDDPQSRLPITQEFRMGTGVSWSPDGVHLAYHLIPDQSNRAELQIYNVETGEIKLSLPEADPHIAVAWTAACAEGLEAADCELGYKKIPTQDITSLVGLKPSTGEVRLWEISPEQIFELRWSPDKMLLYSRPKRHFINPENDQPAYPLPPGGRLANMSPDARYIVYYQPFTLIDCRAEDEAACLHLGVWLARSDDPESKPELIYSIDLSEADRTGGLNFVPTWTPESDAFVFFQEGRLIYYDLEQKAASIWYKPLLGKLRSIPVFSPNEEAVAFVDNQGQGYSEYRLVIINPKLQPIEHVIDNTQEGLRVLAWLPN